MSENTQETLENVTKTIRLVSIKEYETMQNYVADLEDSAFIMTNLFDQGTYRCEKYGSLTLEKMDDIAKLVTSLYSTATTIWGKIRGIDQRVGTLRKYYDNSRYLQVKNEIAKNGLIKPPQKEIEAMAAMNNKEQISEEVAWGDLYCRITACRETFEQQLRSLEFIWKMQQTEKRFGQQY